MGRTRWKICGLLGLGAFVNYVDRVNLSIAAPLLARELDLSPAKLGILFSIFLWTYAMLQIPIGSFIDQIGIKWILRASTFLWVVATLLTAFAGGLGLIVVARLLLGIAETPMMPAAWKATGYWFPQNERGMSTTVIDGSAKLSNVIGIPLMALVVGLYGWRAAFLLTAALSFFYFIAFWVLYRDPSQSHAERRLARAEYDYMLAGGAEPEGALAKGRGGCSVIFLLGRRKTWGLSIGYASYTYAYYLLLTWLPGYLSKQMGLNILSSGLYTAIPWLVAVTAQFAIAGWWVDKCISRGRDPVRLRRVVLTVSMLVSLSVVGAAFTHSISMALIFLSIGAGGLAVSAPTGQSIVALIAPDGSAAKLGGIVNFVANFIGILAPIVTGLILQATGNFAWGFITAGLGIVLGIFSYTVILGRIEKIPWEGRTGIAREPVLLEKQDATAG